MHKATIRGLLAHKLRLALTTLAIVLGVGFVAGTLMLTDSLKASFDDVFAQVSAGIDVQVRSATEVVDLESETGQREPLPASLLDTVTAVEGVEAAEGTVLDAAIIIDPDGEPIMPQGPPTLGGSIGTLPDTPWTATVGRDPSGPGEVVIDQPTFERHGFELGQRIEVVVPASGSSRPRAFTLVGAIEVDSLAGATFAGFDLATAQALFGRDGTFDTIDVAGEPGVAPAELSERIAAAVGPGYEAVTGESLAAEQSADVKGFIDVLSTALLAFAGIALFVGAFIIHNTFSITVAQRTRELALLRCIGASRRQVRDSVLLESALIGLFASVLGLGFGALVAPGLLGLMAATGADLPASGPLLAPRTVLVALLVGTLVTVVSALLPARRATRVPPVAAMRDEHLAPPRRSTVARTLIGSAVTALGIAAFLVGLLADLGNELALVGAGAAATLIGVGALGPLLARPLARAIGAPMARRLPGRLARSNAMRSPKRTASTAAALMIGVAIISFFSVFAASARASIDHTIDRAFKAEYQVAAGFGQTVGDDLVERLDELPELATVTPLRQGVIEVEGRRGVVNGIDPAAFPTVFDVELRQGSLAALGGGISVTERLATERGWKLGTELTVRFPNGTRTLPVRSIHADSELIQPYLVTLAQFGRGFTRTGANVVFADVAPGVAAADARAAIDRVVADYPTVTVRDTAAVKESVAGEIDRTLVLLYALLGLSVLIALFGIVNTLVLSVFERVRELGLLRAIGMGRSQVRRMIRWESVIIAVIGAAMGLAVGTLFGWGVFMALRDQGFEVFRLPVGSMAALVLLAAAAGVAAAVLPARRASRVDMLRALAAE